MLYSVKGLWLGLAGIALLAVGVAQAQQPSPAQRSAIKSNCRSDYMSFCSSIPPGGMASLQCLQKNSGKLAPACHKAVAAVSGGAETTSAPAPATAPAAAAAEPAAAVAAPGPGAGEPAPDAAAPYVSRRETLRMLRFNCRSDFQRYCNGTPLGGGRVLECLAAHRDALTPACRRTLAAR